jgi:predicted ester cyclase
MTSDVDRFVAYALAFEEVLASNDWASLERFFAPNAEHVVVGGGAQERTAVGREQVLSQLRRGVDVLDRRFDRRVPAVLAGPVERDGAVRMDWRLTLEKAGLPDCVLEGDHAVFYDGDLIARIEEHVSPAMTAALEAYLKRHDGELHPVGGPVRGGSISRERMAELVAAYACAKSNADVSGALACCRDDFALETVSFGVTARGKAEAELHLRAFFHAFPDYRVSLEDLTFGEAAVGCWGTAEMTMRGGLLDVPATGRRVTLPIFCAFRFADGFIASERFFFDLAALCGGIGLEIEQMIEALRPLRDAERDEEEARLAVAG